VPDDEGSVAEAIARHPSRLVGYFMLDATKDDAENRVVRALERGLRGVCLFPAMQRYSLHDERVSRAAIFGRNYERLLGWQAAEQRS
jgi:predicted TIM-barrel fold metal-dependent hydrolase